jgi:hypothetical protein
MSFSSKERSVNLKPVLPVAQARGPNYLKVERMNKYIVRRVKLGQDRMSIFVSWFSMYSLCQHNFRGLSILVYVTELWSSKVILVTL